MKNIFINGICCEFDKEQNVLEIALKNGIDIPHLCYCEKLSSFGGCRLCVVEADKAQIEAACTLAPRDGMNIKTNSLRLRKHRQMMLELMLASHRADCTTCAKSGVCLLQQYAKRFGVRSVRFANDYRKSEKDESTVIIRDPSRCVLCGRCVRVCSELQGVRAIDFAGHGSSAFISAGFTNKLAESGCVSCGGCAAVCPTAALTIKDRTQDMWRAVYDPSKTLAVQIDSAVIGAAAESFGVGDLSVAAGKLVTALKTLGAEYVFYNSPAFASSADALAKKLKAKLASGADSPVIGSGCYAWRRLAEAKYPKTAELLSEHSSAMTVFAAQLRSEYADSELFCAAVMPCSAAIAEAEDSRSVDSDGDRLIDLVLTTAQLIDMIKEAGLNFALLTETEPDELYDEPAAAEPSFSVSGAMTRAVLSRLGIDFDMNSCCEDGLSSFEVRYGDKALKLAVVNGLKAAASIAKEIEKGVCEYDLIEVNACSGGCIGGSAQPAETAMLKKRRASALEG